MQVDITTTNSASTSMRSHVHIADEPSTLHSQHKKSTPPMIHSQDDDSDSSTDDASDDEAIFRATQSTGLLHKPSSRQSSTQLVQHPLPTHVSQPQKAQKPALLDLDGLEDGIGFSMSAATALSTEAITPQTQTTDRAHRPGGKRAMRPAPQALLLDNTESVAAAPSPCSSPSSNIEEVGPWGQPSPVWKKARVQAESTVSNNSLSSSTKDGLHAVQSPDSEPSRRSPSLSPQDDPVHTPLPKQQEQQRQSMELLQINSHGHEHEHKHDAKKSQIPVNIHIELLNDKDDNDDSYNDTHEDNCYQDADDGDHQDESTSQAVNHVSSARLGPGLGLGLGLGLENGLGQAQGTAGGAHASANRSSLALAPTITTFGLTRTLSHMNPHPHHSHPHTYTHTRNFSSPSLLDSFTSPEPMLSPIQSYFGSDPNSIASAFSLPRHDHYPRLSVDDPHNTAGPLADGYHGYATYPWSEQSTTPSRALSHRWTRRLSHPDSIPSTPSRLRLTSAAPTVPIASAALGRTWQETLQSTSHPLELSTSGSQAMLDSVRDLVQDDQDLEDEDNAMGESYDFQNNILQSEDDTERLEDEDEDEDERDDESYSCSYSATELDDELYGPQGPEEDGDSDMDDQGSEPHLIEDEDTFVSCNPRRADPDSSTRSGRHADTYIEDDDVGNALAHVLGLGRLEDDRLAGTLHRASSDSPGQSVAPIDEFSALVGTAVS
ncbi:hypothetical protein MVEG_11473 [Podila verticillata NRRL 6337]|uniref:Uncharacterized protein n=1 Tax=Podila verticillata NRRL 6337 TaxID=1069443 RepID=A0A086TJY5_9FUNG|nr:hypothetical protein MVEG_11473 [Podila verticillata NRRL 6337]